ncbi:hypothetical protein F7P69_15415 [Cellulosimicrobium funkei]|nr:hypothetical protein [Cellulosimicrobium funkei]
MTKDGQVAGVVFARDFWAEDGRPLDGLGYAISIHDAKHLVERWTAAPEPTPLVECQQPTDVPEPVESNEVVVDVTSLHVQADAIAQSLALHGNSINTAQYDVAFNLFTPDMQGKVGGLQTWEEGVYTSYWRGLWIADVSAEGDHLIAETTLVTEQSSEYSDEGWSCTIWPLNHRVKLDGETGFWLIDGASLRSDVEECS